MGNSLQLSTYQFGLLAGTFVLANLAAFWYLRRHFFTKKKEILSPDEWREFELIEKRKITHNTAIYRFKLPSADASLPLPIGQHIQLGAIWDGKEAIRSYTPITLDDTKGYFELLVKTYAQGNASRFLDSLKVGQSARFKGPKGRFVYRQNMASQLGMIAGGTGITPILQVIKAILRDPRDKTKMSLVFANLTEDDILLYEELKALAAKHSEQFKVHFVLNEAPENWNGSVGYIDAEIIKKHCPAPAADTRILMCGPPAMMSAMTKILTEQLSFTPQSSPPTADDQIQRF